MAFDQTTRNRLQRFVNDARRVLEEEFTRQLQNDYGMDPNAGSVADLASLRHINDAQRETARILRDTLAHYTASGDMNAMQGLDRIVREQAFTVLNRLAALRMAEARGLLVESVGNGFQAKGFQLYARLAGTGLGETGDAYRVYLFSVFDELAQDLPGLFDRYSPQGRLFPREAALLQVLQLINDADIAPLWGEDETIGWIYQYFNSKEERQAMREARAPRNSRELAVRNQFFTPRYVVEFLVDNTLGRLWFNATGGQTDLRERCQYLLVKPDETPQAATKLRDPRTLKLLDPACGSMHFGLYAFDLFAEIYREAWAWEQQHGPGSLDVSTQPQAALKPLSQTYADEAAFLRDIPRLIIEHNIYGVDIDPRAAQIASLALWLRAQRAWHDAGVKAKDRPLIGRGHVIAAIAPPAERELRQQFAANLDQRDAELFEKTLQLLKGLPELGVLLQVERELTHLVRQVYMGKGTGLFAQQEQEGWQQAEARLRVALTEFARAAKSTYQGRLFAQDALQGLRLVDLCREVFDVVVMNPPFGEPSRDSSNYLKDRFPRSEGNILAHFIERAAQLVRDGGFVGAIVSRTCFFLQSFAYFRKTVLEQDLLLENFADLGHGVLDAMVETAAATWKKPGGIESSATFFRELITSNKRDGLLESINSIRNTGSSERTFTRPISQFSVFDDRPYVYWLEKNVLEKLSRFPNVEPTACVIRVGLQTGNDFRFLRLWWEVDSNSLVAPTNHKDASDARSQCIAMTFEEKSWAWYSKTESASPFLSSIHLVSNWKSNGAEIKAYHEGNGHSASKYVMSESLYFNPGISYMLRSSRLVPYIVPSGVIPTAGRSQVFPKSGKEIWLVALLASNLATAAVRFRGANFWQPTLQNSMVAAVPYVEAGEDDLLNAHRVISSVRKKMARAITRDETDPLFSSPPVLFAENLDSEINRVTILGKDFDYHVAKMFGINEIEFGHLEIDHNEALIRGDGNEYFNDEFDSDAADCDVASCDRGSSNDDLLSWCVGIAFGRFDCRLATGERTAPAEPEPFDPLPAKSPGMLPDGAASFHAHAGILVDDPGHPHDLALLVEEVLARVNVPVPDDVRRWLQRDFFPFHLQRYSKSRRKAPIYWPLSTTSGGYTLWAYYPSLTSQTLYTAINDFVEPKLKQVGADVTTLRNKGSARTRDDEKQFESLQAFELELIELRDTLLKLAPTYKPNHDDGVQISAAPLWPLFRHKPWQKVLKDTWAKLEKGDYDWAHLAMNYWPERVREKCKADKSLAIAHGLEDLYVEPEAKPQKKRGRKKGDTSE